MKTGEKSKISDKLALGTFFNLGKEGLSLCFVGGFVISNEMLSRTYKLFGSFESSSQSTLSTNDMSDSSLRIETFAVVSSGSMIKV